MLLLMLLVKIYFMVFAFFLGLLAAFFLQSLVDCVEFKGKGLSLFSGRKWHSTLIVWLFPAPPTSTTTNHGCTFSLFVALFIPSTTISKLTGTDSCSSNQTLNHFSLQRKPSWRLFMGKNRFWVDPSDDLDFTPLDWHISMSVVRDLSEAEACWMGRVFYNSHLHSVCAGPAQSELLSCFTVSEAFLTEQSGLCEKRHPSWIAEKLSLAILNLDVMAARLNPRILTSQR